MLLLHVTCVSVSSLTRYLWADNTTVEPLKLSAPAYVQRLFEWIENQLSDESIFPTELDQPFPSNFKVRRSICRQQWRSQVFVGLRFCSSFLLNTEPQCGIGLFCGCCLPGPFRTQARVSRIFRRLFRVYAHIYYSHFEYIVQQSAEVCIHCRRVSFQCSECVAY